MKKIIIILITLFISVSANAFDLGKATNGLGGDKCVTEAASLAQEIGSNVFEVFNKVQSQKSIKAEDLNISQATLDKIKSYIKSGCVKEILTKAANAL